MGSRLIGTSTSGGTSLKFQYVVLSFDEHHALMVLSISEYMHRIFQVLKNCKGLT